MPTYRVTLRIPGNRVDLVRKRLRELLPEEDIEVHVRTLPTNPSRADRLEELGNQVESIAEEVESLRGELEEWRDGLPENLQSSQKADDLNEAIDQLQSIEDELTNVDFSTVSFPSMM